MYYLQGVNTVSYWDDHFKIIVINLPFYLLSPSFWTVTNFAIVVSKLNSPSLEIFFICFDMVDLFRWNCSTIRSNDSHKVLSLRLTSNFFFTSRRCRLDVAVYDYVCYFNSFFLLVVLWLLYYFPISRLIRANMFN